MHELFKKRRSIRKYKDKEVTDEQVKQVLCAAMVAPSGNFKCPWEFVVVRDKDMLAKLSASGQYQYFIADSNVAIVVCSTEESKLWREDCSLAAGHIYLEAVNQGISTCWANISDGTTPDNKDREQYVRDLLGIPSEYRVLCIMPLGYADESLSDHSEASYDDAKVHRENW